MSTVHINELFPILLRCWMARTNLIVRSKPAVGKTSEIERFIEKMQKKVPEFTGMLFYVPTMSPMDIQATCPDPATGLLRMYNNQQLPNAYTNPDMQGLIFLDEVFNGDGATVKLLQKYGNGEDMGTLKKPKNVMVVAAGNRLEDKSGVQQHGRAFLSRFEQIEVFSDAGANISHAKKHNWHPNVQTFFKDHPNLIDNYDEVFQTTAAAATNQTDKKSRDQMSEEGKNGIWANMRSWERLSKKEYAVDELKAAKMDAPLTLAEMIGNVGSGVGAAYLTHRQMLGKLVSFEQILADPKHVAIPQAPDELYTLAMVVAIRCTEMQMPQVKTFGERLPLEIQAVILRHLSVRAQKGFQVASAPGYVEWISKPALNKLMNGR